MKKIIAVSSSPRILNEADFKAILELPFELLVEIGLIIGVEDLVQNLLLVSKDCHSAFRKVDQSKYFWIENLRNHFELSYTDYFWKSDVKTIKQAFKELKELKKLEKTARAIIVGSREPPIFEDNEHFFTWTHEIVDVVRRYLKLGNIKRAVKFKNWPFNDIRGGQRNISKVWFLIVLAEHYLNNMDLPNAEKCIVKIFHLQYEKILLPILAIFYLAKNEIRNTERIRDGKNLEAWGRPNKEAIEKINKAISVYRSGSKFDVSRLVSSLFPQQVTGNKSLKRKIGQVLRFLIKAKKTKKILLN